MKKQDAKKTQNKKGEIRKCPFCGNTMTYTRKSSNIHNPNLFQVACAICGASGPWNKTTEQAQKDWNTWG